MSLRRFMLSYLALCLYTVATGQIAEPPFTHADTLRGSITPERAWWDVQRYDISIEPVFQEQFTSGTNTISYKVVKKDHPNAIQVDLMHPLTIDRIVYDSDKELEFTREGNFYHVKTPPQQLNSLHTLKIAFSGHPKTAKNPPWQGGWSFSKDKKGRPWMTVTCQGLGASVWYPNKDHQSDEPDNGASLTIIVDKGQMGVSNGRLVNKSTTDNGKTAYKWAVVNPINNYTIIPYIGHYENFHEVYQGEKGALDLNYWVLDYNLDQAKAYLPEQVHNLLNAFEYWFGPYPFYEDGYKLVETEHLGMEHQSAIAYGNQYITGYRGRDLSGTGIGLLWDFIAVHESGHEWFGNNITGRDLADMWIQESFTNYSETLFTEKIYGKANADDYVFGTRSNIRNDKPIIPAHGVNAEGSGDMYYKGANMLHSIRHSLNNDSLFRDILRGLNTNFYHQTVSSEQIQQYMSKKAGFDFSKVFEQYLNTTEIPHLQLYFNRDQQSISYRYSNCVKGFNLPLVLKGDRKALKLKPTEKWQTYELKPEEEYLFTPRRIEFRYYLNVEYVPKMTE